MEEQEIWKDIQGYEGFYQVSNFGRVKSLTRPYRKKEKILSQNLQNSQYKYPYVGLSNNSKTDHFAVHYLVASTFIEDFDPLSKIIHKNNVETDNNIKNLCQEKNSTIINNKDEIWKDIPGYEEYYQISNHGRIKSLNRISCQNHIIEEKIRKATLDQDGYYKIILTVNGNVRSFFVHRIVATVFIPNVDNLPQINHKNCIKIDNRVENLEWTTSSENILHAFHMGVKNQKGEKNNSSKFRDVDIMGMKEMYNKNKNKEEIIKKFNISKSYLTRILKNKIRVISETAT